MGETLPDWPALLWWYQEEFERNASDQASLGCFASSRLPVENKQLPHIASWKHCLQWLATLLDPMKSLIYWIFSWEWRRSKSVSNKHEFICGHLYHLRCLVDSKMFGPTSWWLARRENRPLLPKFINQDRGGSGCRSKNLYLMICVMPVGTHIWTKSVLGSHTAQQTLTRSRLVFLHINHSEPREWDWKIWTSEEVNCAYLIRCCYN